MFDFEIIDIELSMSEKDFKEEISKCIDSYSESMNYEIKTMKTRMGATAYKILIDNTENSSVAIVAQQDVVNGNIHFSPIKLSNYNDSFYKVDYHTIDVAGKDNDPCRFLVYVLNSMCRDYKGNLACIDTTGTSFVVKDGKTLLSSIAVVDSKGNVYSSENVKKTSLDMDVKGITVKKPIAQWLQETPEVANAIASASMQIDEKMNYVGKYLIESRIKDELDADEFIDIFQQAGTIGFSDKTLTMIYKLFV